jgi:chromosome segregation ATPase
MVKIKYFLVAILVLLIGGYFFRSNIINEHNREIEKIEQKHQVSQNKIAVLQKDNVEKFDKNTAIERRYEGLKKARQKVKIKIKTKTIKVDDKLYVPKKEHDDLENNYNKVCKEFDLYKENTKKIKINVIELNKEIKTDEANREDMKDQYERTIKKLKKGWVVTFGGNMTLCPDGKVRCGIGITFGKRIF